jgi:hypothetical protein
MGTNPCLERSTHMCQDGNRRTIAEPLLGEPLPTEESITGFGYRIAQTDAGTVWRGGYKETHTSKASNRKFGEGNFRCTNDDYEFDVKIGNFIPTSIKAQVAEKSKLAPPKTKKGKPIKLENGPDTNLVIENAAKYSKKILSRFSKFVR